MSRTVRVSDEAHEKIQDVIEDVEGVTRAIGAVDYLVLGGERLDEERVREIAEDVFREQAQSW